MDLRDRVVVACDSGVWTRVEVAEQFGVSRAWVHRLLQRRRDEGSYAPRGHGGGHPPAFSPRALRRLEAAVARQPDATLEELRDRSGVSCSVVTVHNTLKRLGYRRKKRRSGRRSRIGRTLRGSAVRGDEKRVASMHGVSASSMKAVRRPT